MSLLTFAQQQTIKPISKNNEAKYSQIEQEVEDLELTRLLGVAFKQDVQNNPATSPNVDLINGATFTDCNGDTVTHRGLKYVIAYMFYSQYMDTSEVADTFTGFKTQTRQEAAPMRDGSHKRLQKHNRDLAMAEWSIIKQFLDEEHESYPLWECAKTSKPYAPKFYGVRNTKRYGRR